MQVIADGDQPLDLKLLTVIIEAFNRGAAGCMRGFLIHGHQLTSHTHTANATPAGLPTVLVKLFHLHHAYLYIMKYR